MASTRTRFARGVLAVAAVCAWAWIAPQPVLAHASLLETSPSQGAVLDRGPTQVVLRFDETVSTLPGSLRVFDSDIRRVDEGNVEKPSSEEVSVGLPRNLPDGTYAVAWRVLSEDSHPIHGAFVFSVGGPAVDVSAVIEQVLDAEADSQTVDLSLAIVRFVGLAAILLSVGGAIVLAFVAREARTRTGWKALAAVSVVLAVDSIAWIAVTGVKAAGFGLGDVLRWPLVQSVLETGFGQAWLARALLALALTAVALIVARNRSRGWSFAAVAVAVPIAVTPALSGHARVEGPLAIVFDAIHVGAAGVWVGGLAFLSLMLVEAGGDRRSLAVKALPRFSALALASVIALAVTGVVSGFLEVRSWQGLWDTTYGRLLLVKAVLLLALVALGALHRKVSVPRSKSEEGPSFPDRRFARTVAVELALMIAVVVVTTALVAEPPAKGQGVPTLTREGRVGPYAFTLTAQPARVGPNELHVYVLDSTGQPAAVDEIELHASLPAVEVGPLEVETTPAGPGHVVAAAEFPLSGDWQLRVDVRKGDFDQWSTDIDIPLGKD